MCVTVVVPSFNRAQLLRQTIPSYLQESVSRIVLVDDCSTDSTPQVARELGEMLPNRFVYLRNEVNRKQTFSKNRGMAMAKTPYIYFGDDDSILAPGSIAALLETMQSQKADLVGAAAPYCRNGQSVEQRLQEYRNTPICDDPLRYVDLRHLRFCFNGLRPSAPLPLPVLTAAHMMRRNFAGVRFDEHFIGNCFREETDFTLSCFRAGARVLFDPRAVQINLSPKITGSGGSRGYNRLRYEWHSAVNTLYFLRKHREYFRSELGVSMLSPMMCFLFFRVRSALRKAGL